MDDTLPASNPGRWRPRLGANTLILLTLAWWLVLANGRFWRVVADVAPAGFDGLGMRVAAGVLLALTLLVIVLPLSFRPLLRPWLSVLLLVSAVAGHFMSDYGAVLDRHAIQSVFETNAGEAREWLDARFFMHLLVGGVLPIALLWWPRLIWRPWPRELLARGLLLLGILVAVSATAAVAGREVAQLLRVQRSVRHLLNPYSVAAAIATYVGHTRGGDTPLAHVPLPPATLATESRPRLLVLVLGESARAQSFGLYGYARDTTPELAALRPVVFLDVRSCGTNTATSVPCMFSDLGRVAYSKRAARQRANLLDILAAPGAKVRWYDNNTGSKGVAARTGEIDLYDSRDPRWCSTGCADGLLVDALRQALQVTPPAAEVIVLHTKGSHGPAYAERYPPAFARFSPACPDGDLSRCTRAQVLNAYDNSILYTDHVLAEVIRALQAHPERDSAMLYVSDHGESTGEHGLYLHGAPYALAPEQQTRIPMLLWASPGFPGTRGMTSDCLAAQAARPWSHDNLFDLVLGLMDVRTPVYQPGLDPLATCRTP